MCDHVTCCGGAGHGEYILVCPLSQIRTPLRLSLEQLTAQLLSARGQYADALPAFAVLAAEHGDQHWARGDYGIALFRCENLEVRIVREKV